MCQKLKINPFPTAECEANDLIGLRDSAPDLLHLELTDNAALGLLPDFHKLALGVGNHLLPKLKKAVFNGISY